MKRADSAVPLLLIGTIAAACAARTPAQSGPSATDGITASSNVMVMAPVVSGTASPGNVGRDFPAIETDVANRILSIVRERFANAALADSRSASPPAPRLFGYDAAAGQIVSPLEMNAAVDARARGATHLLVPTITEWKQMRAEDPVGALILPHNSVTISLRLMRLAPPALTRQATFHNKAHLTLNQQAARLLDDRFRRTVLRLLEGAERR
jgi:hypothetical protein